MTQILIVCEFTIVTCKGGLTKQTQSLIVPILKRQKVLLQDSSLETRLCLAKSRN